MNEVRKKSGNEFKLAFPGLLRLDLCAIAALVLMVMQLATGTLLEFAELTFLATFLAAVAINLVGGLCTLAGWCIAVIALKSYVISQFGKIYYGEPGESNLEQPFVTMGVMAASMVAICLAGLACAWFRPRWVALKPVRDSSLLRKMAI